MYSEKTAKYVQAMIREGDAFSPHEWVLKMQAEEHAARKAIAKLDVSIGTSDVTSRIGTNPFDSPEAAGQIIRTKQGLDDQLRVISDAWDDMQMSRRRNSVYDYLNGVFGLVERQKGRKRVRRMRRALEHRLGRKLPQSFEPYGAVIAATANPDEIDGKTISKWSRALRYVAMIKPRTKSLQRFMREVGGINACATAFTKHCKTLQAA